MERKLPNRITFQWHVTDQCNLRCTHCYQDNYTSKGLSFKELEQMLDQLISFVHKCRIENNEIRAHINFTGGEPFLREDLIDLIVKTKEVGIFTFGILSNGLIPSNETLKRLKALKPKFIQISLEGNRETNDKIRGQGSYSEILNSLKTYQKFGIPTMISFTANAENYLDYPHVVKIARRYKAFKIWTDRYIPCDKNDTLRMNTEQFKKLGLLINKEKQRDKYFIFSKTNVSANRALQFLFCGDQPYKCSAGNELLAFLANGDILPCRRLPIKLGNLLTDSLIDLYKNTDILNIIHSQEKLDIKCLDCYYKSSCNGGLKCLSYATSNDFNKKDINCWI